MAFKGTAGKSASGASMSKYDVEVEARLQKLESHTHDGIDANELQDLKKTIFDNAVSPERLSAVEKKLDKLIAVVENELHPGIDWDE